MPARLSHRQLRTVGSLAVAAACSTILWVVLMAMSKAATATPATLAEKIELIRAEAPLYRLTYLNAAALTVCGLLFMTALYVYCRSKERLWSTIGFAFVPLYGLANLLCYLSQVFLVPRLLELHLRPETRQTAETLLALSIHTWPGSVVETVNGLAYALLGVPSILFPLIALKRPKPLAFGGFLLLLSGVLSIVAFAGALGSVGYLTGLSVAGGVIYLLSLCPIAYCFLFRAADLAERPAQN